MMQMDYVRLPGSLSSGRRHPFRISGAVLLWIIGTNLGTACFAESPPRRKVVLIKGTWNASEYGPLKMRLKQEGYRISNPPQDSDDVLELNLSLPETGSDPMRGGRKSIADSVQHLKEQLIAHVRRPNADVFPVDVDIIAHSAGGLAARRFNLDPEANRVYESSTRICTVRNLITLGTPYGGIFGCNYAVSQKIGGPIIRDMQPKRTYRNGWYGPYSDDGTTVFFGPRGRTTYWGLAGGTHQPASLTNLGGWLYAAAGRTEPRLYDGLVNVYSAYGRWPGQHSKGFCTGYFRVMPLINHAYLPRDPQAINLLLQALQQGKPWPWCADTVQGSVKLTSPIAKSTVRAALPPETSSYEFFLREPDPSVMMSGSPTAGPQERPLTGGDSVSELNQTIVTAEIVLQEQEASEIAVPVDIVRSARFSLLANAKCAVSMQKPDGSLMTAATAGTTEDTYAFEKEESREGDPEQAFGYSYRVAEPAPGTWKVRIKPNGPLRGGESAVLTVTVDSRLSFEGSSDSLSYYLGTAPKFLGALTEGEKGQSGGTIFARVSMAGNALDTPSVEPMATLPLVDDGRHNDGAANDGVYGGQLKPLENAGIYSVAYTAQGTDLQGRTFQRQVSTFFVVEPLPSIPLTKLPTGNLSWLSDYREFGVNKDANAAFEGLAVTTQMKVYQPLQRIWVQADLVGADGKVIDTATEVASGLKANKQLVSLLFPARSIVESDQDGPYTLKNIRLYTEIDGRLTLFHGDIGQYLTKPYNKNAFSP